jgi:hypothetical protein
VGDLAKEGLVFTWAKGTGVHYEVSTLWELPTFLGSTHELSLKPGASHTTYGYVYVHVIFGVYECG